MTSRNKTLVLAGTSVAGLAAGGLLLTGNGRQSCPDPQIKGNVSYKSSEKIYHVPGSHSFDETVINSGYGEKMFCTEQDAQEAGFRKAGG